MDIKEAIAILTVVLLTGGFIVAVIEAIVDKIRGRHRDEPSCGCQLFLLGVLFLIGIIVYGSITEPSSCGGGGPYIPRDPPGPAPAPH